MYRKYVALLVLGSFIFVAAFLDVRGVQINRLMATEVFRETVAKELLGEEWEELWGEEEMLQDTFQANLRIAASGQRVIGYRAIKPEYAYELSPEEYEILLRIVEAEAGGEDEDGKLLVANVVLNRVNDEAFPDTVKEVVFQRSKKGTTQFSPVRSGRFYRVKVSEETIAAVERALLGEDISMGALFFASRKYADSDKMRWFDEKLTFLFEHGGHEFFR